MVSLNKLFGSLLLFTLFMNMFIGFFLVGFVAVHDYVGVGLIEVATDLESKGMLSLPFITAMEELLTNFEGLPVYADQMFLASFVTFVTSILYGAYRTQRQGYVSVFGLLTLGIIFLLFLLSIWIQFSQWLKEIFFSIIPTLSVNLVYFNWYMSNAGVINMIIILCMILLSLIDLDLKRFDSRKQKEGLDGEI